MEDVLLFLMEFLVDKVNVPAIRAIHEEILPAKTCVSFQILDLIPLNIYQETPTEACACTDKPQIFRKGKSCLFALPSIVLQKPLCSFPVTMSVYKELPPGVLPDVMLIGSHQIQARDLINALLIQEVFLQDHDCRTMKDTFRITTATGQCVGEVTVFIRASCFGKKIVTQFQIPRNGKPYLFKGVDEDAAVYQCKRITSALAEKKIACACAPKKINDGSGEDAGMSLVAPDKRWPEKRAAVVHRNKCPPCCRGTPQLPVRRKETVRKCGCVVREDHPRR